MVQVSSSCRIKLARVAMADIKDIFGESDSEEEEDQGGDVGKLFELSDDDDDDDLPVAPPPARSRLKQRGAPGGPPKPKAKAPVEGGNAYDSDDEPEEDDADRAFIDAEGDDQELLAEYANEKQDFREDRPGGDDFEADERAKPAGRGRDDDNPMAPTLNRMKRKRTKEMATDEKDKVVSALLGTMDGALKEDAAAAEEGAPALAKLKLLPVVERVFKQKALANTLLDFDALDMVAQWLAPGADGSLPTLAVREALLRSLGGLPAQPEHLKRSGLGKVVMRYARNKKETEGNRRLARKLVEAWSRPVVGKHVDMKNLEAATEMRFKRDVRGKVAAVDQKKDDADEIFAKEGEESKDRPRVRVPNFNGFDFTVRPLSGAEPVTGRRKAAPSADSSKGRLAKKIKKR